MSNFRLKVFSWLCFTVIFLTACSQRVEESVVVPEVKPELLERDVRAIVGTDGYRNYKNPEKLDETATYIRSQWELLGLKVEDQMIKVRRKQFKNVLTHFGPEDAPRIVVGAHYDVEGKKPGADDNASGVAGLLALARMLKEASPKLKYRVDLVAYCLEEPPYFRTPFMGSAVHALSLVEADQDVKLMISLEMIGYFTDEPGSQDYPIEKMKMRYPDKGNFICVVTRPEDEKWAKIAKEKMSQASDLGIETFVAPTHVEGIDFSDHLNYWAYDMSAIMITDTSFYRNKNYHTENDTPDTLDYKRMADVIAGVYVVIVGL